MKVLPNDIVLRPRFQLEFKHSKESVLNNFTDNSDKPIISKRIDDHIFLKINKKNIHFWSPQLHLEINDIDANSCKLYGVFGPNPSLWTFFMFLHFGIATIFIIFGIWGYANWSLDKPYAIQLAIMIFMTLIWISLYVFGRIGKKKGNPQMKELHTYMQKILAIEK